MTTRHLKRSASVRDRLVVLGQLRRRGAQEMSSAEIAEACSLTPARASVLLYEMANQGHISRRTEPQRNGPGRIAYFKHVPGYEFEVYQSKSNPRRNQKRGAKPKAGLPLLETVWGVRT